MTKAELARRIDHTALKPDTREKDIRQLCQEAVEYGFASVCVMPYYVMVARDILMELESEIPVCTVVGFPNGAHLTEVKQLEARCGLDDGARELDMVINIGALKSGKRDVVTEEIESVVEIVHEREALLKVILETGLLKPDEIRRACEIAVEAGADFLKTSTGFFGEGATIEVVKLMRECCPEDVQIKASGGIGDTETAIAMIEAGADRLGCSRSVQIVKGLG